MIVAGKAAAALALALANLYGIGALLGWWSFLGVNVSEGVWTR